VSDIVICAFARKNGGHDNELIAWGTNISCMRFCYPITSDVSGGVLLLNVSNYFFCKGHICSFFFQ
jgi:hypothetical protein